MAAVCLGAVALLCLGSIFRPVLPWLAPYVFFALAPVVHPVFALPGLLALGWAAWMTIRTRGRKAAHQQLVSRVRT